MTFWIRTAGAVVFGSLLFMTTAQASAQGSFGLYGVRVSESVDGERMERGLGLRVGISFPLFPLKAYAAAERIFPRCPDEGCSVWAAEAGLSLTVFPFPVVSPYLTGGIVRRRYDSGIEDSIEGQVNTAQGISAGAGVSAGLPGISFFLEGRYEFLDEP